MLPLTDFKDFIVQNSLFSDHQRILLTVSGGRDSVLMAHLFKLSGYEFGIAHCNFNLRSDESQRDEHFVRVLAATLDAPFYVTHFKTKEYAAAHNISTQMAARELRYNWFEKTRTDNGYDLIAVAQHRDDAIETVLLNLTRGTGIAGMHGILPKRGNVVRPMLFLSRDQIDDLVNENSIDFVEDSSNLSANYARNKIRLRVIPQLKEINPAFGETFEHNIKRFAATERVLQKVVAGIQEQIFVERNGAIYLSIESIKALDPLELLVFELLRQFGFSEHSVSDIIASLGKQSGTSFYSKSHCLLIDRANLIISPIQADSQQLVFVHDTDRVVLTRQHQLLIAYSEGAFFDKSTNIGYIDADKLIYPLIVRYRQRGDRFMPLGMRTLKKLSNFFIDEKVPVIDKDNTPILLNGNGEIVWIGGLRADERYKVSLATKKTAILELIPQKGLS
jgi:tRNA(Ile)-lysidine synthase